MGGRRGTTLGLQSLGIPEKAFLEQWAPHKVGQDVLLGTLLDSCQGWESV